MPEPLPPTTLTWLRQSAAVDGAAYSQVLLHLLERVEALEQRPTCKQIRAALERLLNAVDVYDATGMDVLEDAIAAARTALANG
jgi:hypothetical protein